MRYIKPLLIIIMFILSSYLSLAYSNGTIKLASSILGKNIIWEHVDSFCGTSNSYACVDPHIRTEYNFFMSTNFIDYGANPANYLLYYKEFDFYIPYDEDALIKPFYSSLYPILLKSPCLLKCWDRERILYDVAEDSYVRHPSSDFELDFMKKCSTVDISQTMSFPDSIPCDMRLTMICPISINKWYATAPYVAERYGWNRNSIFSYGPNPPNIRDILTGDEFAHCDDSTWNPPEGTSGCYMNLSVQFKLWEDDVFACRIPGVTVGGKKVFNLSRQMLESDTPILNSSVVEYGSGGGSYKGGIGNISSPTQGAVEGNSLPVAKLRQIGIELQLIEKKTQWMDAVINIIITIFSFILLMYYVFVILILTYIFITIPSIIYNKILNIIREAGEIRK